MLRIEFFGYYCASVESFIVNSVVDHVVECSSGLMIVELRKILKEV
jgi:hypothetical protein